jgi:hypothetical protein
MVSEGCQHCRVGGDTYAVPEPVGGRGEGNATGTDRQREDLANDHPGTRTPGGGEEKDVDADEGDHCADSLMVTTVGNTDDGDQKLADDHPQGAPDQQGTTAQPLHGPERNGGRADVDDGGDHVDQEGIGNGAQGGEERGAVVEDEIDTGQSVEIC